MEFVILVISAIVAALVHYLVRRDINAALAFGVGLVVFALVPLLAAVFSSK